MQAPIEQIIQQYLHDLAFDDLHQRIKREFIDWDHTQEEAFIFAENDLRTAYFMWHDDRDAVGALTSLDKVRDMYRKRLTSEYQRKYNDSVSYFEGIRSRSGTPVHDQDVHMQSLLLRMTACLYMK